MVIQCLPLTYYKRVYMRRLLAVTIAAAALAVGCGPYYYETPGDKCAKSEVGNVARIRPHHGEGVVYCQHTDVPSGELEYRWWYQAD